jgi:hypothetical protein
MLLTLTTYKEMWKRAIANLQWFVIASVVMVAITFGAALTSMLFLMFLQLEVPIIFRIVDAPWVLFFLLQMYFVMYPPFIFYIISVIRSIVESHKTYYFIDDLKYFIIYIVYGFLWIFLYARAMYYLRFIVKADSTFTSINSFVGVLFFVLGILTSLLILDSSERKIGIFLVWWHALKMFVLDVPFFMSRVIMFWLVSYLYFKAFMYTGLPLGIAHAVFLLLIVLLFMCCIANIYALRIKKRG